MSKLEEMLAFVSVVETGSIAGASKAQGLTPSAMSKLLSRLELRLGVQLLLRSPRGVRATPEGDAFYNGARKAIDAVEDAEGLLRQSDPTSPAIGTLRISSLPTFARCQLAPLMPEFLHRHPRIRLEFILSTGEFGFLDERIDVAIRSGRLEDSSAVVRRIASFRWILCASPAYLAENGRPRQPQDLLRHNCLNFTMNGHWTIWKFRVESGAPGLGESWTAAGNAAASQGDMLLALAKSGLGIARLSEFHVADELATGSLVPILEEYEPETDDSLYAVFPSRRYVTPRLRSFLDFLDEKFSRTHSWMPNQRPH